MSRACAPARRGLSLIEAVAAVVVLSIAVPPTLSMLSDASAHRGDSITITRATIYAQAVLEQVIADASSSHESLGFAAFNEQSEYLSSLESRLEDVDEAYAPYQMSRDVAIGELADESGVATGDSTKDVFRRLTVKITFLTSSGQESLVVDRLLTEVSP